MHHKLAGLVPGMFLRIRFQLDPSLRSNFSKYCSRCGWDAIYPSGSLPFQIWVNLHHIFVANSKANSPSLQSHTSIPSYRIDINSMKRLNSIYIRRVWFALRPNSGSSCKLLHIHTNLLSWSFQLQEQYEQLLALYSLDSDTAWDIGSTIRDLVIARYPLFPVVISITHANSDLLMFVFSHPGVKPEQIGKVQRIRNAVNHFNLPSVRCSQIWIEAERSEFQTADIGGWPIAIRGVEGVIAVRVVHGTGYADTLITEVLGTFMKKEWAIPHSPSMKRVDDVCSRAESRQAEDRGVSMKIWVLRMCFVLSWYRGPNDRVLNNW